MCCARALPIPTSSDASQTNAVVRSDAVISP